MDNREYYLSLPHDMSGSMSKNRFRLELMWGISKMLDVYDSGDFTMVFDYACDIELHVADGFEFYQIKTHNGKASYTWKKLTTVKGEGSILGKLYVLNKCDPNVKISLAVVSNSMLKVGNATQTKLEYCFEDLPDKEKAEVCNALKNELGIENVDLSKVFFIHTDMNLADPKNEIMGKLIISFQKIKGCEPNKPNALYRLIYETVEEKACYEYSDEEYDTIISHKGLTKEEFDKMLDIHASEARTGIKQTEEYIESLDDLRAKRIYKKALPKMMKAINTALPIKLLEKKAGAFLVENEDAITDIEAGIDLLTKSFHGVFPPEYDHAEKTIFYMIVINRYIEGVYDNAAAL